MSKLELNKITELTLEDINKLIIHSTRSGIRRAAQEKPMITVPGDDKVPTLHYIREFNPETQEGYYSIHALSSDLTKFLLMRQVSDSSSDNTEDVSEGN
jgi:hypothetical protein